MIERVEFASDLNTSNPSTARLVVRGRATGPRRARRPSARHGPATSTCRKCPLVYLLPRKCPFPCRCTSACSRCPRPRATSGASRARSSTSLAPSGRGRRSARTDARRSAGRAPPPARGPGSAPGRDRGLRMSHMRRTEPHPHAPPPGSIRMAVHRTTRGGGVLATSVPQRRHDPMEQGPTEPHAGRSTFLLSSGGAGGRVLLSGRWYGADCDSETVSLPDASGMSGGYPPPPDPPPSRPKDHRGETRNLPWGKSARAIFGPQSFGPQTPPSLLLILPCSPPPPRNSPAFTGGSHATVRSPTAPARPPTQHQPSCNRRSSTTQPLFQPPVTPPPPHPPLANRF